MTDIDRLHEINLKRLEHEYETLRQDASISATLASGALKALFLLNGGALIALFTLAGGLKEDSQFPLSEESLIRAAALFVGGIALAFLAQLGAYFVQECVTRSNLEESTATYVSLRDESERDYGTGSSDMRRGKFLRVVTITAVFMSLFMFCAGSAVGLDANRAARDEIADQARSKAFLELRDIIAGIVDDEIRPDERSDTPSTP